MKVYRYTNMLGPQTFSIALVKKPGEVAHGNAVFGGLFQSPGNQHHPAATIGPDQNACHADIERLDPHGGPATYELCIGTIFAHPQGFALGPLLIYHALMQASRRDAISRIHITDGHAGREYWRKLFPPAIRVDNAAYVPAGVPPPAEDTDFWAPAGQFLPALRNRIGASGWRFAAPELVQAGLGHPLMAARLGIGHH